MTVPKIPQEFLQTLNIILNLGKISKQQKSHQNLPRKFKQNAAIKEKSALRCNLWISSALDLCAAHKPNALILFFFSTTYKF